jgi:hypothetical protein
MLLWEKEKEKKKLHRWLLKRQKSMNRTPSTKLRTELALIFYFVIERLK